MKKKLENLIKEREKDKCFLMKKSLKNRQVFDIIKVKRNVPCAKKHSLFQIGK